MLLLIRLSPVLVQEPEQEVEQDYDQVATIQIRECGNWIDAELHRRRIDAKLEHTGCVVRLFVMDDGKYKRVQHDCILRGTVLTIAEEVIIWRCPSTFRGIKSLSFTAFKDTLVVNVVQCSTTGSPAAIHDRDGGPVMVIPYSLTLMKNLALWPCD